jgi:putative redox protein
MPGSIICVPGEEGEDTVDIQVRSAGGKRVEALIKDFTVMTDQSVKAGGEGSAPAPFDLFLASLATCAGIYVYEFCIPRNIPVDDITITMHTERSHETGMLTTVDIDVHLPADFPKKYEAAVVRAVDLCAVKKHLAKPPPIHTKVNYAR